MERKCEKKEKEEEEKVGRSSSINGNDESSEKQEEDINISNILKNQISCHALYDLLLQSHLDCCKICLCNMDDTILDPITLGTKPYIFEPNESELDQFMESYCITLKKLKEEMEEPQKESMAFISYMHSQLKDLINGD